MVEARFYAEGASYQENIMCKENQNQKPEVIKLAKTAYKYGNYFTTDGYLDEIDTRKSSNFVTTYRQKRKRN